MCDLHRSDRGVEYDFPKVCKNIVISNHETPTTYNFVTERKS